MTTFEGIFVVVFVTVITATFYVMNFVVVVVVIAASTDVTVGNVFVAVDSLVRLLLLSLLILTTFILLLVF